MSQRVNAKVWNGNIIIRPPRESSKRIQQQEMLTVFGESKGLLPEHDEERGSTVNSEMQCDELKRGI